jgi:hypothetical protein
MVDLTVFLVHTECYGGTCRLALSQCYVQSTGTVRVFRQKLTLEDAIGTHPCPLEVGRPVTNGIPLGCPRFLPVHTVNCIQTLKVQAAIQRGELTWTAFPFNSELAAYDESMIHFGMVLFRSEFCA